MKFLLYVALFLSLGAVLSVKPEDECRVIRVKNDGYKADGDVETRDPEDERAYWNSEGYDVLENDANWLQFNTYGPSIICMDREGGKEKSRCIPFLDPEHEYTEFQIDGSGVKRLHTVYICANCSPGGEDDYNVGRCDCGANQYCERQYREELRTCDFNNTCAGTDKWTSDHGICRDIPGDKIGTKCIPELTGAIDHYNDLQALDPEEQLWCGDIRGWQGSCYNNECHECTPPNVWEAAGYVDAACQNAKGELRWCNNGGAYQSTELEGDSAMRDISMTVFLAIIMVATVTSCIIGCVVCKKG